MEKLSQQSSTLKFNGKTVVVTGSGTGIGQAIAKKFAENGANIIIMGRRKEPLDQTSEILNSIIRQTGSPCIVRAYPGVDVADEKGINEMFDSAKKEFGKVDIVVNNAGVSGPVKTFTNASVKDFRECVAIHLTGTFWTSVKALDAMDRGGKIITISTFFSEENRYEQRPYRFRTPYTASQGAKNRLAEVLAWELVERGISSIATNPGPVHSDRIYKTVYPKAAAEFLRIGGYPELTSVEIEKAATKALPLLGEPEDVYSKGIKETAQEIASLRKTASPADVEKLASIIEGMLAKIQEIAEKIQGNTSKMIVDGEFLSQEDVATMVLNLCDDKINKLINGRVIPNDRVFYPVKPIIGTSVDAIPSLDLGGKVIILTVSSSSKRDINRVVKAASALSSAGAKQVIVLTNNSQLVTSEFKGLHSHSLDLADEEAVRRIFNTAKTKFGSVDGIIHFTGDYDYNKAFSSLSRKEWDFLVNNFIHIPGLITKEAVNIMAPMGAPEEPSKYRGSKGVVVVVGPDAPAGKKISGMLRARADVFRGALRPYVATANQELGDVLGSEIRAYLILAGNTEGAEPNQDKIVKSVMNLVAGAALKRNEAIFYIDEGKA